MKKKLTLKWIHSDLLSEDERLLDLFLLDALDPQRLEAEGHRVGGDLEGANALFAALFPHQVVGVRPVRRVRGDARDDHHGSAFVSDDLRVENQVR